jgi:hypothetical protein
MASKDAVKISDEPTEQDARSQEYWKRAQELARLVAMSPKWQTRGIADSVVASAFQWIFRRGDGSPHESERAFQVWMNADRAHAPSFVLAREFMRAMREGHEARFPEDRDGGAANETSGA